MENLLNYYYGLIISNIKKENDYYLIESKNGTFILSELFGSIEDVQIIINLLNKTNIKYHLLVLTKNNDLYITYEERNYCLLKIRCDLNQKISLITFNNIKTTGTCNWGDVWSKRIDYYESQVEELIKESSIKYALQYYIGLTEISIYYFNILSKIYNSNDLIYSLAHKQLNSPIKPIDYYNPLNMIIDIEIRDLAEYFKSSFFNEILTDYELLHLIDSIKFSDAMANYLFLRLLYPSYFFNLYDEYIETKNINHKMVLYIKKSKDYESLLSKVYSRLSLSSDLKIKLWFIKARHL